MLTSRVTALHLSQKIATIACLLFLSSCSKEPQKQALYFSVTAEGSRIDKSECVLTYAGKWKINQLHWFVSNFHIKQGGDWVSLAFETNNWQMNKVALLSLANANCEAGNLRKQVDFSQAINWQQVEAVKFDLGVPFTLNHQNPLQQPSPLNLPNMFWSWQMGHKFLRLDMQAEQHSWSFHLGSVGCVAATRVRAPDESCSQPNLFTLEVPLSGGNKLALDLSRLLQGIDPVRDKSCMFHGHGKDSCKLLLKNIDSGTFH